MKFKSMVTVLEVKKAFKTNLQIDKDVNQFILIIRNCICHNEESMLTIIGGYDNLKMDAYMYVSRRPISLNKSIKLQLPSTFIQIIESRYNGAKLYENQPTSSEAPTKPKLPSTAAVVSSPQTKGATLPSPTRGDTSPVDREVIHQPIPLSKSPEKAPVVGWSCPACTFINIPTRPGCEICSEARPENYQVPNDAPLSEEDRRILHSFMQAEDDYKKFEETNQALQKTKAQENYETLLALDQQALIPTHEEFDCSICLETIAIGEGVVLRSCFHQFCRDCLRSHIMNSNGPRCICPNNAGGTDPCEGVLEYREMRGLLAEEEFESYLCRENLALESKTKNTFHCRTANCVGWAIVEEETNLFKCSACNTSNCLTCKAQHNPMTCQEYQLDLRRRAARDENAKADLMMLENMLKTGEAMKCPSCEVILQKKDGCDWLKCTMCGTELCWATRGARWGPKGKGDISGGCRCGVQGKCHPNCGNCH